MSRWTVICDSRKGGEWVQKRGDMTTNPTDGGGSRIEGGNEKIQKTGRDRWGEWVRIKCVISNRA